MPINKLITKFFIIMKKIKKSDLQVNPRTVGNENEVSNSKAGDMTKAGVCGTASMGWATCAGAENGDGCGGATFNSHCICVETQKCVDSESHAAICCAQTDGEATCANSACICLDTETCQTQGGECAETMWNCEILTEEAMGCAIEMSEEQENSCPCVESVEEDETLCVCATPID